MELKGKHSLGQNFLKDELVLDKIIDCVNINDNDIILEIGPGMGALTNRLKKFNTKLICFEIDLRTKPYLDKLIDNNTKIIYEDFMNIDLKDYIGNEQVHVVANIPYYITTPIIDKIINSNIDVLDMTLMVQKEVANRLSSKCGNSEYGYFTVYLNYYFDIVKLFDVDKKSFNPVPKVDSAVIKLIKNKKKCNNEEVFFKLIKDSFRMKRKNLKNNLSGYNLNIVNDILNNYGHDLSCRAEDISVLEYIDIANNL